MKNQFDSPISRLNDRTDANVLVFGDLMLDRYTWGDADRVSPEAPVMVLRAEHSDVRPGGAAAVAAILRRLGAAVSVAGVVGDDHAGRSLQRVLQESGADAELVQVDSTRPTTTKERFLGKAASHHAHQMLRVDHECAKPLALTHSSR